MQLPKIKYNAPLTLSYLAASLAVLIVGFILNGGSHGVLYAFTIGGKLDLTSFTQWFRLFSHILGHQNFQHFLGNFTLLLLIGPLLEEKYGVKKLLIFILITAFLTGLLQCILFEKTLLLGASGIVFLFIVMSSMSNFKHGEIPVTFILIIFIYLGNELVVASTIRDDHISHYAHIMGGVCGAIFGFVDKRA